MAEKRHIAEVGAVALYGLIEELVGSRPSGRPESAAAARPGAASKHDALTAVAELARAIEIPAQDGDLDPEQAHQMASLLLVIRDFIEPVGPAPTNTCRATSKSSSASCTGRSARSRPADALIDTSDSDRSAGRPCQGGVLLGGERVAQDG